MDLHEKTEDELLDIAFDCYLDGNAELLDSVTAELQQRWK